MFKNGKISEIIVWTAVGITLCETLSHDWRAVAIFFGVMLRQQVGEVVGRLEEMEVPGFCRGKFRDRPKGVPQYEPESPSAESPASEGVDRPAEVLSETGELAGST